MSAIICQTDAQFWIVYSYYRHALISCTYSPILHVYFLDAISRHLSHRDFQVPGKRCIFLHEVMFDSWLQGMVWGYVVGPIGVFSSHLPQTKIPHSNFSKANCSWSVWIKAVCWIRLGVLVCSRVSFSAYRCVCVVAPSENPRTLMLVFPCTGPPHPSPSHCLDLLPRTCAGHSSATSFARRRKNLWRNKNSTNSPMVTVTVKVLPHQRRMAIAPCRRPMEMGTSHHQMATAPCHRRVVMEMAICCHRVLKAHSHMERAYPCMLDSSTDSGDSFTHHARFLHWFELTGWPKWQIPNRFFLFFQQLTGNIIHR